MYSQTDPKWAQVKLGKSPCTIGRFGCTTTSICNIINDPKFTPDVAAKKWAYTPDGLLDWQRSDFSPLKFVERVRGFDREKELKLKEWLKLGNKAILHVKNKYIPFHWIMADRVSILGFITGVDPLGAKLMSNVKSRYQIEGYALFFKKRT